MADIGAYPFVQAKWFTHVEGERRVRVVVIHDMEAPENATTAENVAKYFQNPGNNPDGTPKKPSAHLCIDNDSTVRCVHDNDVANAAPGCNADGIQLELAGYARQTREQWLDSYSRAVLELAADATAQYCRKYGIPITHLSNAELQAGAKGIVGHYQVSQVYHKSDHADPGPGFPWDVFLASVAVHFARWAP